MTTTTTPLTAWLGQVLDAKEAAARAASPGGWHYGGVASIAGGLLYDESRMIASVHYEQPGDHDGSIVRHLLVAEADANGAHIAAHDPAAVLAMVEGLRAIVALHEVGDPDEWGPEQWACRLCQWDEDCDSPKQSYQHGAGRYPCPTLRHVAAMFASEPGYDEAVGS